MNYLYAQPQNFTGYIPHYTMMSYSNNGTMINQECMDAPASLGMYYSPQKYDAWLPNQMQIHPQTYPTHWIPTYSQPHYSRKNSEWLPYNGVHLPFQKPSVGLKTGGLPKKSNGRKRVFSTTEGYVSLDKQSYRMFPMSISNTKDSSTSSGAKYGSPNSKQMSSNQQEPKSIYLMKLRQLIKDNGEDNIRISDLKDHIIEISLDQIGSRYIQKVYESSSFEEK